MALITAAEFKTWRGISASTYDAQLAVIIPAVQAAMERFCGRVNTGFDQASYTETLDGDDSPSLFLEATPIATSPAASVTHIADDGTETVISTSDYRINTKTGEVFRLGSRFSFSPFDEFGEPNLDRSFGYSPRWSAGRQNWKITYTGGYSTIPADLKMVTYDLVARTLGEATSGDAQRAVSSETLGAYSYTLLTSAEQFDYWAMALAAYRKGRP